MRDVIKDVSAAERFMADILAAAEGKEQSGTGSDGIERQLPVVEYLGNSSRLWASANFEGTQHEIRVGICGLEDDVDGLAALIERDLITGNSELLRPAVSEAALMTEADPIIDMIRLGTDKTINGDGHAASVLTFLALSLAD